MEKEKSRRGHQRRSEESAVASQALADVRDTFNRLLESSSVTVDTQWRVYLEENKSHPLFNVLPLSTALDLFMAYIQELEKRETRIFKLAQIEDQKIARKLRENYRAMLEEKVATGELNKKSIWTQFAPSIAADPGYLAMANCKTGATPRDLFDDLVSELKKQYKQEKKVVAACMKDLEIKLRPDSDFDSFFASIIDSSSYRHIEQSTIKQIFEEMKETLPEAKRSAPENNDEAELIETKRKRNSDEEVECTTEVKKLKEG